MRRAKRWVATGLVAGLSTLFAPLVLVMGAGTAFACTCAPASDQGHFKNADVVFQGRLINRQEPPQRPIMSTMDPATLTFEVSVVYKGDAEKTQKLTTPQSGASCGLEIKGEGPFLVFANENVDESGLTGSLCGGTRPVANDTPPFGPGYPPQDTSTDDDPPTARDEGASTADNPSATDDEDALTADNPSATGAGAALAVLIASGVGALLTSVAAVSWIRQFRLKRPEDS